jgi:hypothetical protein
MKLIQLAAFIIAFAFIACHTPSLLAQTQEANAREEGELSGVVLDLNKARVAGAKVILENKR